MDSRLVLSALAVVALGTLVAVGVAFAALSGDDPPPPGAGQTGTIDVTFTLEAEPPVAARTWAFEVVDSADDVVARIVLTTADAQLRVTARSSPLPHGAYSVRQVLTDDDRTECGPGALYAVVTPPGGSLSLRLERPVALAQFVVTICE